MAHAQKPDLVFQRNGRVHLNRPEGGSVQSTTGSRGVRISGSNAGFTMFWGRVQDYWLPTPLACFPFTSPTVRHRVPSGFNWALLLTKYYSGDQIRMWWAGYVARMGERSAYRGWWGDLRERTTGETRRRWEDNIKMDLQNLEWGHGLDWSGSV